MLGLLNDNLTEIYMPFFNFLNSDSDITDISWKDREIFKPLEEITELLMRGDSSIPIAVRELIAAYVSSLNSCQFCFGSHAEVANHFGISDSLLEQLIDNVHTADIDDSIKAALLFAKKLTLSSSQIIDYDLIELSEFGWQQDDVQQIIYITSLFNFYNRVLDGHGIKGNQQVYEFSGKHLAKRGYKAPPFVKQLGPWFKQKIRTSN